MTRPKRDARPAPINGLPTSSATTIAANNRPQVPRAAAERPKRTVSAEKPVVLTPASPTDVLARPTPAKTTGTAETEASGPPASHIDYSRTAGVLKGFGQGTRSRADLAPDKTDTASEKLGRNLAKAKRLNCETAHADLGILAIPLLLFDTVTDTGCRW